MRLIWQWYRSMIFKAEYHYFPNIFHNFCCNYAVPSYLEKCNCNLILGILCRMYSVQELTTNNFYCNYTFSIDLAPNGIPISLFPKYITQFLLQLRFFDWFGNKWYSIWYYTILYIIILYTEVYIISRIHCTIFIVITLFRLIWQQMVFHLVPSHSEECKYNLIFVIFI